MPKAVILGGTGFIGSVLAQYLRQSTNWVVEAYGSSQVDLTSPDSVENLAQVADENTVLVVTARWRQWQDQFKSFANEITMGSNVARFLSQRQVKKCVYFSSIAVYGDGNSNLNITEETPVAPTSLYGVAKFASECVIKQTGYKNGIPVVLLRPCMVYGPGDTSTAYGPTRFIQSILREGKVRLFSDGTEQRSYIYIADLVKIIAHFAFGEETGIYNLATGHSHSFQEIIAFLRKITERDFEVVHLDRDRPKTDQKVNPAKLMSVLPGFRFTDFEKGLIETNRYFATKGFRGDIDNG